MLHGILGALLTHPALLVIGLIVVSLLLAIALDPGPRAEPAYNWAPIQPQDERQRGRLVEYCALEAAKDQARAERLAAERRKVRDAS